MARLLEKTMEHIDDKKWKVLNREYLFRRPWLTVRRDEIQLPNGNTNPEFYVLEYPDWVNVIAITKDDKFVMIRQYRHGIGDTYFEICAGVAEEGEEFVESAKRELYEETGYGNGTWSELMTVSGNTSTTNNLTHCFLAEDVEKISSQHLEPTEDISVHIMTRDEVYNLLIKDEIKQSLMAAPLWKYFATYRD